MVDYSAILTDISKTLLQIAQAPNYPWIAPIAVLLSALLGWWASQWTIRRHEAQRARDSEAQKTLVFQLLRDEITLRWNGEIRLFLRDLLKHEPLKAVEVFHCTELKSDDLFTFKSVSTSFADYFFLDNPRLISEIVHGYLLVCDLVDLKSLVGGLLAARKAMHDLLRSSLSEEETEKRLDAQYGESIRDAFGRLPKKLDAIDARFSGILAQIGA